MKDVDESDCIGVWCVSVRGCEESVVECDWIVWVWGEGEWWGKSLCGCFGNSVRSV